MINARKYEALSAEAGLAGDFQQTSKLPYDRRLLWRWSGLEEFVLKSLNHIRLGTESQDTNTRTRWLATANYA